MKPYYGPHAGITIYHGDVVNCDLWTQTKELGDIGLESVVKTSLFSALARKWDTSRIQNILRNALGGVRTIMHGWGITSQKKRGAVGRRGYIEISGHVGHAVENRQSVITSTAIQPTTRYLISRCYAVNVTWKGMVV